MDINTLLGWVVGIAVLVFGIMYDKDKGVIPQNIKNFIDVPSIAVVLGGCISGLMVAFPLSCFAKIPRHMKIMFMPGKYRPQDYIQQIVDLATEARINGLLSLEGKLAETKDEFLKSSMMLVVDAVEPDKVKQLLETELDYLDERHAQDRAFYDKAGAFAPAFGMIGTLIGLVKMLKNLTDSSTIGPNMAVALLTTLYGSIIANWLCDPTASKLKVNNDLEMMVKEITVEGLLSIQAGENPRVIEEKLKSFLAPSVREGLSGQAGGGGE